MANPLIYHKQGWIEMICGCMFSGKTEELIRRVRTALIAKQKVQLFNSKIDTRYGIDSITSHNQNKVHVRQKVGRNPAADRKGHAGRGY